jgi:hypothetical protein
MNNAWHRLDRASQTIRCLQQPPGRERARIVVAVDFYRGAVLRILSFLLLWTGLSIHSLEAQTDPLQQGPPLEWEELGRAPQRGAPSDDGNQGLPNGQPSLTGPEDVPAFISWAGASTADQRALAREIIASASKQDPIAKALIEQFGQAVYKDHSRALLILSILGEMRNPVGGEFLVDLIYWPLPETGTIAEGEIVERSSLEMLQAKAVDGVAYLGTFEADEKVLNIVAQHPSRTVRAEAIAAYLWNHGHSPDARQALSLYVREDEKIFLDRVSRDGDDAKQFDAKLKAFLKAHPEVIPPAPTRKDPQK